MKTIDNMITQPLFLNMPPYNGKHAQGFCDVNIIKPTGLLW